jgi:hypothetical protein
VSVLFEGCGAATIAAAVKTAMIENDCNGSCPTATIEIFETFTERCRSDVESNGSFSSHLASEIRRSDERSAGC